MTSVRTAYTRSKTASAAIFLGMRGCVLYGRFVFSNPAKNRPAEPDTRSTVEGGEQSSSSG
jgi:hypothetical protein